MLTKDKFEVLVSIENTKEKVTQVKISKDTYFSVGKVNSLCTELLNEKLIDKTLDGYKINNNGTRQLTPYKVKRAIFIAAGFGSRLVPITLNTPKPLIMVHGTRIIDSLLDAVLAAGIEEIIIVRGYLKDQFDVLKHKYPNIKFIDNPIYNESNNISSVYLAREYLENAYILESDLLLFNPKLIRKYEYNTNYLGIQKDVSEDWCFQVKKGVIKKTTIGGTHCHQMVGISFWNQADGSNLCKDIEKTINSPGGKELYWDQVALEKCIKSYCISLRNCSENDVVEIDTFNELKQIDDAYDC